VSGTVADGFGVWVGSSGMIVSVDFGAHPAIKITNKVNMIILDEFNGIKRPFVILR
jgi:hypothetical protein